MIREHSLKPIKKPNVHLLRVGDFLYIGGYDGAVSEIPDPRGSIERLMQLMDGTRTLEEIHAAIEADFPEVTYQEVLDAAETLHDADYLENAALSPEGLLDEHDLARWQRNLSFFSSFATFHHSKYALQHALKTARIALLGVGGLGTHILYDLAAIGACDIRAVEFDRIELSNLNRQILYNEADVGRLKAEVATERMRAFSPQLKLEVLPMRLASTADVLKVISDRDYVVCVADQPKTELINWVNRACLERQAILISGGLEVQRAIMYTMIPGITGCIECWRRQVEVHDPVSVALLESGEVGGSNATFVSLVSMVTGLMVSELTRIITGIAPPASAGRVTEVRCFDAGRIRLEEVERWHKLPDCPVCQDVTPRVVMPSLQEGLCTAPAVL
jgi:molybdopterin/thiamine biosynthesis adenylyltransferase